MKRVAIYDFGGSDQLKYEDADRPAVEPGKLLICVEATSVNPVDWKIRSGAARAVVQEPMPVVLGGDIAGIVEEVGDDVTGWAVGDEVFAHTGLTGAYAEFVALEATSVARKPAKVSFAEAASLPLVALTAWQGFLADGRDLAGLNVLVHNGAGGVGTVAVQIAKAKGARVLATASSANAEFVRDLGADEVVDFRTADPAARAADMDIMMDLVGNKDALALWSLVRSGGSIIRIAGGADAPPESESNGIRALKVRVRPNGAQLAEIAEMVDQGKLKAHLAETLPLAEAARAHDLSQGGHVRGKIVLAMR